MVRATLGNTAGACADLTEAATRGDKAAAATVAKNCKSPLITEPANRG
jgi:hypothetical protein